MKHDSAYDVNAGHQRPPGPCRRASFRPWRPRTYAAVIASVCAASASAGLTTHLVAHYALDGNAYDTGPFANHGVVYEAGVTADRYGRQGRALTFDGFNDYVRIADSESLNLTGDFTLSAWIISCRAINICSVITR